MSINDMSKEIQELKDKLRRCEEGRNIMHKAFKQVERQRNALLEYIGDKED